MVQSLTDVRLAYDLACHAYAEAFIDELQHKPRDCELLEQFATRVGPSERVLDLGCGPGHTTAHLHSLGLRPTGVDLSPQMIATATTLFPHVEFATGDFFQLTHDDCSVAGILALYCIVHLTPKQLTPAFSEMFRVLRPGGSLLLSFHVGTDTVHVEDFLETGAKLDFAKFPVADVQTALSTVRFAKIEVHERPPYASEYPTTRCYIFASKTPTPC